MFIPEYFCTPIIGISSAFHSSPQIILNPHKENYVTLEEKINNIASWVINNCRRFADGIFKFIFMDVNNWILIKQSRIFSREYN